jgi:CelD/BcsL family acetyltransferase involved in cellulose biosynthesis
MQLRSIDELRGCAEAWDRLWQQCESVAPTARAELVAQWVEHFGAPPHFTALTVEEHGELLAALPLIGRRIGGVIDVASLPGNCWSSAGQLLVGHRTDDRALDMLVRGLSRLRWPLLWLEGVQLESANWQRFMAALARARIDHEAREDGRVGVVEIDGDFEAYQARWSKNHRKNMRKTRDRLRQLGNVACTVHRDVTNGQVEGLLRRAFEVEDRSWKGPAGTSVLKSPGIFEFFLAQARQLAARGEFELAFLDLDGQPIAFEYGYRSDGIYYSHKVGYDERFAAYGPGQLLMLELIERFHGDPQLRSVDCMGPLSDAVSRWTTRTYGCGRLVAGGGGVVGTALLASYRAARPWLQRWRQWQNADALAPLAAKED